VKSEMNIVHSSTCRYQTGSWVCGEYSGEAGVSVHYITENKMGIIYSTHNEQLFNRRYVVQYSSYRTLDL